VVTYQPIVAAVTVTRHPRFNPHAVRQGVSPARASASRPVRLRPVSITVDAVRRTPCATVSRTVRPALTMAASRCCPSMRTPSSSKAMPWWVNCHSPRWICPANCCTVLLLTGSGLWMRLDASTWTASSCWCAAGRTASRAVRCGTTAVTCSTTSWRAPCARDAGSPSVPAPAPALRPCPRTGARRPTPGATSAVPPAGRSTPSRPGGAATGGRSRSHRTSRPG
jgi:hypothetical protein